MISQHDAALLCILFVLAAIPALSTLILYGRASELWAVYTPIDGYGVIIGIYTTELEAVSSIPFLDQEMDRKYMVRRLGIVQDIDDTVTKFYGVSQAHRRAGALQAKGSR